MSPADPPVLRVIRGHPTPEELAALVAVLAARTGAAEAGPPPAPRWTSRTSAVRRPLQSGRDAWRLSTRR